VTWPHDELVTDPDTDDEGEHRGHELGEGLVVGLLHREDLPDDPLDTADDSNSDRNCGDCRWQGVIEARVDLVFFGV